MKITDVEVDLERERRQAREEGKTEYLVLCARCDRQMRLFWSRPPTLRDRFYCSESCMRRN